MGTGPLADQWARGLSLERGEVCVGQMETAVGDHVVQVCGLCCASSFSLGSGALSSEIFTCTCLPSRP